jgi:hypothetical protein
MTALAIFGLMSVAPVCAPTPLAPPIPPPENRVEGRPPAPYGDILGDAWEIEEVSCWRGIWTNRGDGRNFDGYWFHANGERARAPLEIWQNGRSVIAVRRHPDGKYCRYDGTISADWWSIEGRYTCTWQRTPMPWRAHIVRLEYSEPALLRR